MPRAFSAPYFAATSERNSAWYQRQSWMRSLQAKRTVETTSSTPIPASTSRSRKAKALSGLRSMSDPPRDLWPGLPWPVEVPVRTAAERPEQGQGDDRERDQEERGVLRAPVAREPDAGRRRGAPVEPGPEREEADEDPREQHAAEEGRSEEHTSELQSLR